MYNYGATLSLTEILLRQIFMCIKSRGVNILIYIVYGVSSLCYVLMLKLWVKLSKKICAHKGVF